MRETGKKRGMGKFEKLNGRWDEGGRWMKGKKVEGNGEVIG